MSPEKRDCITLLINSRRTARSVLHEIENINHAHRQSRRIARRYRQSGNPVLVRNAEVIEARMKESAAEMERQHQLLVYIGRGLRLFADDIATQLTTRELLDLFEVNPVDRNRVEPPAGITEIVFIHGLEDSATHRGSFFNEGPLFRAMSAYMMAVFESTPELQERVNDGLFGKGGMFEFVPTYSRTSSGEFKRNPPKLRLADEADSHKPLIASGTP